MNRMKQKSKKFFTSFLIIVFVTTWIFSGWPQIFNFPPEIQKAYAGTQTFTSSGTFNVPAGVTSIDITMWGGGSGGGLGQSNKPVRSGGGGGGGAYTECTSAVTAETGYSVTVGAVAAGGVGGNSSSFPGNDGTCTANGGNLGVNASGGAGGIAQVIATPVTAASAGGAGGSGSNTTGDGGGGGGEAAATTGTGSAGSSNSGSTGGAGGTGTDGADGGRGGDGDGSSTGVTAGATPGGGGGGAGSNSDTGGGGARGEVIITWVDPPSETNESLSQHAYRWFANDNSTDVGGAAGMNSPTIAPQQGTPFRLRLLLYNEGDTTISAPSGTTTDLQFAVSDGTCDGDETYSEVVQGSGDIRYYTGNTPVDGDNLTLNVFDPVATSSSVTVRNQDYEDTNTFTNSVADIAENEAGLWDFALYDFSAPPNTTYCFRAVQDDGGSNFVLSGGYDVFPEITTAQRMKIRLRGAIRLRTVRLR